MKQPSEKPWFGRKLFGWGWGLPQRWEGWATLIIYLLLILIPQSVFQSKIFFLVFTLFATIILFAVIWKTSGKPQWGSWWNIKNQEKYPLSLYVVGVIIVLVFVNCIAWFVGGEVKLKSFELLSGGFLLGMLAMYIAVHIYKWK